MNYNENTGEIYENEDLIPRSITIISKGNLGEFFSALAKAQAEFKPIPKNKSVEYPHKTKEGKWEQMSFKYADLDAILDMVRPPLTKYGIGLQQITKTVFKKNIIMVNTLTLLGKGETLISYEGVAIPILAEKIKPQDIGSAITYSRRYSLNGVLSINTDEDNDANQFKDADLSASNTEVKEVMKKSQFKEMNLPTAEYLRQKMLADEIKALDGDVSIAQGMWIKVQLENNPRATDLFKKKIAEVGLGIDQTNTVIKLAEA